ncbi:FAD/NAD(P)-binding protein [Bosea sp. (in: a-proteobacteria)]|uniref:FAD/NAD(P)-binding protein n=1 Tax=Bosea sp. (in: a-proteobacteria) TaxID=1871050 RepID=UPI002FCC9573
MPEQPFDIAVVGGGASGTLLALHLMRQGNGRLRIALIERTPPFGSGIAYATGCEEHLLNTRIGDMSAWPDDPGHFARWLPEGTHDFVRRREYGRYLKDQLDRTEAASGGRLALIRADVTDLEPGDAAMTLCLGDSSTLTARHVVLATGHRPPGPDRGALHGNPWGDATLAGLSPSASLLLIGTGLTMVDLVVALSDHGHHGGIVAVSRRGLLPRAHSPEAPKTAPGEPSAVLLAGELSKRLAAFRRLVREGTPWGALMLALRPHNAALWRQLDSRQQQRFVRHLRPWWDVHRHRVAPDAGRMIESRIESGKLAIIKGRILSLDAAADKVEARVATAAAPSGNVMRFDRTIDCRGPRNDIAEDAGLIARLAERGLAQPDALRFALAVDGDDRLIDQTGKASRQLFALGPPTRGRHWEITAIPDIRKRAAALAARLTDELVSG